MEHNGKEERSMKALMKKKTENLPFTAICCIAVLCTVSCRKELCYNHWEHAPSAKALIDAEYEYEWERDYGSGLEDSWRWDTEYDSLRPDMPEGLKVLTYADDGRQDERNVDACGELVPLFEDHQSILLYNNDTEYIVFENSGSFPATMATTRTRTRSTYSETHSDEITVNAPDMLYAHYIESWHGERKIEADTLAITMQPLTYTYYIIWNFTGGLQYAALGRGALSGMAQAVYLTTGTTSEEKATILYDCEIKDNYIEARVMSFGIPGFPDENYQPTKSGDDPYLLNLEVKLKNGKTLSFDHDVSGQVHSQPRGGVIEINGLEIPDDIGQEGSGSFDVEVGGWEDEEDIILPL